MYKMKSWNGLCSSVEAYTLESSSHPNMWKWFLFIYFFGKALIRSTYICLVIIVLLKSLKTFACMKIQWCETADMRLVYYLSAGTQTGIMYSVYFISENEVIFVVVLSDFYVSAFKGTKDFYYWIIAMSEPQLERMTLFNCDYKRILKILMHSLYNSVLKK